MITQTARSAGRLRRHLPVRASVSHPTDSTDMRSSAASHTAGRRRILPTKTSRPAEAPDAPAPSPPVADGFQPIVLLPREMDDLLSLARHREPILPLWFISLYSNIPLDIVSRAVASAVPWRQREALSTLHIVESHIPDAKPRETTRARRPVPHFPAIATAGVERSEASPYATLEAFLQSAAPPGQYPTLSQGQWGSELMRPTVRVLAQQKLLPLTCSDITRLTGASSSLVQKISQSLKKHGDPGNVAEKAAAAPTSSGSGSSSRSSKPFSLETKTSTIRKKMATLLELLARGTPPANAPAPAIPGTPNVYSAGQLCDLLRVSARSLESNLLRIAPFYPLEPASKTWPRWQAFVADMLRRRPRNLAYPESASSTASSSVSDPADDASPDGPLARWRVPPPGLAPAVEGDPAARSPEDMTLNELATYAGISVTAVRSILQQWAPWHRALLEDVIRRDSRIRRTRSVAEVLFSVDAVGEGEDGGGTSLFAGTGFQGGSGLGGGERLSSGTPNLQRQLDRVLAMQQQHGRLHFPTSSHLVARILVLAQWRPPSPIPPLVLLLTRDQPTDPAGSRALAHSPSHQVTSRPGDADGTQLMEQDIQRLHWELQGADEQTGLSVEAIGRLAGLAPEVVTDVLLGSAPQEAAARGLVR
ncbi:hypothetical protein H696_05244 [Fonticula alba]|uniref:Uncharacterized protein n=1 Tax=Fonticula alba TaxID=691883 RepID=A0A058Z476_FONAL|nr:hypothetical protein H696_05244 [Fonticula alba]KCV68327.1 hypothetical protein H696_05244 [Fonticula alba]|eukprot:XP_009497381.1 hypothetical protein H696_05244 [Fonticula alba]